MMWKPILFFVFAFGFALAIASIWFSPPSINALAAMTESPIKRWAILSDKNVRATGLVDLVFADLANSHLELVERDELEKVADELTIQALASGKPGERSRVGQLLNADGLIIFSTAKSIEQGKSDSIKLTLCECRQGVRLSSISLFNDKIADRAKQFSEAILVTSQQFAGGIEQVIGVSPFACRNIQTDFDHLQSHYFELLSAGLQRPGVAMLEFEEARTILAEFTAGVDVESRVVPIMVDAEYKVDDSRSPRTVRITANLKSGTHTTQIDSRDIPLDRAGQWITSEMTKRIIGQSKEDMNTLSIDEQKDALKKRVELFETLGDLRQTIQCREALLLIDPMNAEQRMRLIDEIAAYLPAAREFANPTESPTASRRRWDKKTGEMAVRSLLQIEHFIFLIENRLVNRSQAIKLLSQLWLPHENVTRNTPSSLFAYRLGSRPTKAVFESLFAAIRKIVLELYPKILDLKVNQELTREESILELSRLNHSIMYKVNWDVLLHGGTTQALEYLEHVVEKVTDEELPTSRQAFQTIEACNNCFEWADHPLVEGDENRKAVFGPTKSEYLAFLERISNSSHLHLRLYGRLGFLSLEHQEFEKKHYEMQKSGVQKDLETLEDTEFKAAFGAKVDTFISEMEKRSLEHLRLGNSGREVDGVHRELRNYRINLMPNSRAKAEAPPRPPTSFGRMHFEKLDVDFGTFDNNSFRWINCGGKFDLLADSTRVAVMRERGRVETIIDAGQAGAEPIASCQWDGKYIWLTRRAGDIDVFDASGELLSHIDIKAGLPVHDQELRIFPIQSGRVLAYGRHGTDGRCWLANTELIDNQANVKVFLEGRRTELGTRSPDWEKSVDSKFSPGWFSQFKHRDRHLAFLGRKFTGIPLLIDLNTLEVSLAKGFNRSGFEHAFDYGQNNVSPSMVCVGERIFKAYRTGVFYFEFPEKFSEPKLMSDQFIESGERSGAPTDRQFIPTWVDDESALIPFGEWIYKPGVVWYRFRADTLETERLVPTELPRDFGKLRHIVSSQYGLVGWSRETGEPGGVSFYQVQIK